jgi:hypothetical protein
MADDMSQEECTRKPLCVTVRVQAVDVNCCTITLHSKYLQMYRAALGTFLKNILWL